MRHATHSYRCFQPLAHLSHLVSARPGRLGQLLTPTHSHLSCIAAHPAGNERSRLKWGLLGVRSPNHVEFEGTEMQNSIRHGIMIRALAVLAFASIPLACLRAKETKVEQLSVGGFERTYRVSRPSSRGPRPTILVLHGSMANAQMAAFGMGFEALVEREQLVAVYPDAVAGQWNDGHAPSAAWGGKPRDDVEFLRALVVHLVRTGVSDPHRIYVTGFSSGGMMAFRLMCETPENFAAIAPIAATLPAELVPSCKPAPTP